MSRSPWWRAALLSAVCGCAGWAHTTGAEGLRQLREAIYAPVQDQDQNERNSRLVQRVADDGALHGMTRAEVARTIGAGEPCARHRLCLEQEFLDGDWYYEVGALDSPHTRAKPILILGFDSAGRVHRTYVRRIH